MKKEEDILHNERELGAFFNKERKKTIAFLCKNYSFSHDDAEDVYQDSCLALFKNIKTGKLKTLTSKLSTYFIQVCINQALKKIRDARKTEVYDANQVNALVGLDGGFTIDQQQAMEELVKSLPSPCNNILWSYYYDNMNMAEIAGLIHFSNADSVKAKKSQCMSQLRSAYGERIKRMMYETV